MNLGNLGNRPRITAGWANALGKYGVRVNAVNPGNTLTERLQEALRLDSQKQGITEGRRRSLPRIRASYVTGAIIPMDGGKLAVI